MNNVGLVKDDDGHYCVKLLEEGNKSVKTDLK